MTELTIAKRIIDDVVILDLTGDLVFGEEVSELRNEIRRLLAEERSKIWLNLENTRYVDSCGIGELISGLTAVRRFKNGELKLLNPTDRLIKLLEISNLTSIFDISYERKVSVI